MHRIELYLINVSLLESCVRVDHRLVQGGQRAGDSFIVMPNKYVLRATGDDVHALEDVDNIVDATTLASEIDRSLIQKYVNIRRARSADGEESESDWKDDIDDNSDGSIPKLRDTDMSEHVYPIHPMYLLQSNPNDLSLRGCPAKGAKQGWTEGTAAGRDDDEDDSIVGDARNGEIEDEDAEADAAAAVTSETVG